MRQRGMHIGRSRLIWHSKNCLAAIRATAGPGRLCTVALTMVGQRREHQVDGPAPGAHRSPGDAAAHSVDRRDRVHQGASGGDGQAGKDAAGTIETSNGNLLQVAPRLPAKTLAIAGSVGPVSS